MSERIVGTDGDSAQASRNAGADPSPQATQSRCFALAPLYVEPVTRQVGVKFLNDDGTLGDATTVAAFAEVDVELWARGFLGDLDRFLATAAPAGLGDMLELSTVLAAAADSKHAIASGIVHQLRSVLDAPPCETQCDPDFQKNLQAARGSLLQQLQVSLTQGYDVPVIVQADASAAPTPGPQPHGACAPSGHAAASAAVAAPVDSVAARQGVEAGGAARVDDQQAAVRLPVPLRIQPAPPYLGDQAAAPSFALPTELSQLPLWNYRLVLGHEFASQDTVRVTTEFNLMYRRRPALPPRYDLFEILAQYTTVADRLWMALGRAPVSGSGGANAHLNAARTFADFAAKVAAHWDIRQPQEQRSVPESDYLAEASHSFGVRVAYSQNKETIESVSLTCERLPAGMGSGWPKVEVLLPDGVGLALLAHADPSGLAVVYVPERGMTVSACSPPTFRLTWAGLDVATVQNARARVSVVRNEALLFDSAHPQQPTPRTDPAFVFKTAEIVGRSVAPLIERNEEQEIAGADLRAALEGAVQTLFPSDSLAAHGQAAWQLEYSYELARSATSPRATAPIRARLPVVFRPTGPLAGAVEALVTAAQAWLENQKPAFDGAGWILNVVLYSGLESGEVPVFRAELFYRIEVAAETPAEPVKPVEVEKPAPG